MPICGICFQGDTVVGIKENIGLLLSLNPKHSLNHRKNVGRPYDEGARLSCSFPAEWLAPFVPCFLLKWLGPKGELSARCVEVYEIKGIDSPLWDSYAPRNLGGRRMIQMKVEMTISQV